MAVFTNQSKNTTSFLNYLAHGKATLLQELQNMRFTDVAFADGTILKDVTFAELVNATWTKASKNTASYSNQVKN